MKTLPYAFIFLVLAVGITRAEPPPAPGKTVPLFDGKTLAGWEGNAKLWSVEDGAITGGSLTEEVKHNDFLATVKDYGNFIVRMGSGRSGCRTIPRGGAKPMRLRPSNSVAHMARAAIGLCTCGSATGG